MSEEQENLPDDELVRMIGALALDIHINRHEDLSGDVTIARQWSLPQRETADYQIDNKTVRFCSLEARNRVVAAYTFREKGEAIADDAQGWLWVAHELLLNETDHADSAAGRLLALVHGTRDIFSIAAGAISDEPMRVFEILHVLECALPYLGELPPDGILKLCKAQYEPTKNDMAAWWFFSKLENFLKDQPEVCRSVHARLRNEAVEATVNLHQTALVSLAKTSPEEAARLTLEDTEASNPTLKSAAIWTLGQLLTQSLIPPDVCPAVYSTIITNLSSPVDNVRQTAIRAAARAAHLTEVFDECLTNLAESADAVALYAVAEALNLNLAAMKDKAKFKDWVRFLSKVPPTDKGTLDRFDHILRRLISDESQPQFALSCFTEWVRANAQDAPLDSTIAKLFGSTISELAKREELLELIITDWLLSDSQRLASAAAGLLSYLGGRGLKKPEFSIQRLDELEQDDLLFLARRLVGFVFSMDHRLSLAMSFLKTKDARQRTFGFLRSLFVDELGYDYPLSTIEALESARAGTTEPESTTFFSSLIEAIKKRIDALDALPRIAELIPPPAVKRQFAKARAKQMGKLMEEAQRDSVFLQLVTHIPVKGGMGFFSFHQGTYTETTPLKAHSQSVELPRREALDTVGYEIDMFLLRTLKREDS